MLTGRLVLAAAILAAAAPAPAVARAQEDDEEAVRRNVVAFDRQPYKIKVLCAFSNDAQFTPRVRGDVLRRFVTNTDTFVGEAWQLDLEDVSSTLAISSPERIRSLSDSYVDPYTATHDKVFVLGIRSGGDRFLLTGREFDVTFARWGPIYQASTRESGQIARDLVSLSARMFLPLARLEEGDAKRVKVRLKGGRLPTLNPAAIDPSARYQPAFKFVTTGWLFRPMRPELDQETDEIIGMIPMGWTFYEVERRDGQFATCKITSALKNVLPPLSRDPDEPQLIAARTAGGTTVLRLVDTENKAPLPAMDVELREKPDGASIPLGTTDLDGRIIIPPNTQGAGQLVTVFVRHGRDTLGRLPVLPGAGEEPDLALKPNAAKLDVDGRITPLQEQLIDEVALRTILGGARDPNGQLKHSLIMKAIAKKDFKQALDMLNQLKRSSSMDAMMAKLDEVQKYVDARIPPEKQSASIKKLFIDTKLIIELYFNPDEFAELVDELDDEYKTNRAAEPTPGTEEQPAPAAPSTSG